MTHTVVDHGFHHGPMEQIVWYGYADTFYRITELVYPDWEHIQHYWVEGDRRHFIRDARMINWFFYGGRKSRSLKRKFDLTKERSYDPLRQRWFRLHHASEIHPPNEIELKFNVGEAKKLPAVYGLDFPGFFALIGFEYKSKTWF